MDSAVVSPDAMRAAMAAPPQAAPPFDTGNTLLAEQPAQLVTALIQTPGGQRLALTIRTASATMTVFLAGRDAKAWAARLSQDSAAMSASGLVVAGAMPGGAGSRS